MKQNDSDPFVACEAKRDTNTHKNHKESPSGWSMNCLGWQPCSYKSLSKALIWRHVGKPQVPWNPKSKHKVISFLQKVLPKKDVMHSLIEGAISSGAHVNLQFQVINPTHIGPSNGCLTINRRTYMPFPAWLHKEKKRKWILNLPIHLWFTNIYSIHRDNNLQDNNILCRHSLKEMGVGGAKIPYQRERRKESNSFLEWEFQCIPMQIIGADDPPVSELGSWKAKCMWHHSSDHLTEIFHLDD